MTGIEHFLATHLKLTGNKAKSAVATPQVRKCLGFSFTNGTNLKLRLAPQTVVRFKAKVRELTRRTRGRSLAQIVKELSLYLIGWLGYFGFSAKLRRCCASSNSGPGGGCAPSPGNTGDAVGPGLQS